MATRTSGKRLIAAARRAQALALRKEGRTLAEIGSALSITPQGVHKIFSRVMADLNSQAREAAENMRDLESGRIDALWAALWPRGIGGDEKAIGMLIRLSERRCRLLGLDGPLRIAETDTEGRSLPAITDEERLSRIAALLEDARHRRENRDAEERIVSVH